MTIKHAASVDKYAKQVTDCMGALENLQEFIFTLPAPDEDGNIPNLNYGHLGTLDEIHSHLTAAMEHADEMFERT